MQLKDLKPNVKNPRKMTISDKNALKKSLQKFGDLGCIIYNRRTKCLVGGHQRNSVLPQDSTIKLEVKYSEPTEAFTVAEGYVLIDGERFKYREVDAPEKWETEALLAANKHSGEWDKDILKLNFSDFPDMDLESIGFDEVELEDMGIAVPSFDDLPDVFDPNETDAQYIKNNKGPESYEGKERIPNTMLKTLPNEDTTPADIKDIDPNSENPFDDAGKKTDIVGKRFVLIIDLKNEEDKQALKEKIRPLVKEVDGKFF